MTESAAEFRFYEELNDFLPPSRQKTAFAYAFSVAPSIKDAIEAIGVPHTEVDLIVVDGRSVEFEYRLQNGNRVAVYPTFESVDVSPISRLKGRPLRETRFVVDTHLGKLARWLRMLGFDTLYRVDYTDAEIVAISTSEPRIILTRDRGILKNKLVKHGYWLRSTDPRQQIREVVGRFDLYSHFNPFARCTLCNGLIRRIESEIVRESLPRRSADAFEDFFQCAQCGKVYWQGSHYDRMKASIETLRREGGGE